MTTVTVDLGRRSYNVLIGPGLLAGAGGRVRQAAGGRSAYVITDSNVGPLYATALRDSLAAAGYATSVAEFPAGEPNKTLATMAGLFDQLFAAPTPPDRHSVVVALGGGVVGDMAGFVAATLLRGLRLVQSPRRCWPTWTPPSAARPAWTTRPARTSSGRSTSPRRC